ncbi:MAG TPA: DUF5989 family protein [Planctomycetota bacterium]
MNEQQPKDSSKDEFLNAASQQERGLVAEFVAFMAENKVWWMAPILIVFALLGVLLVLGATGVAPFLYSFV